MEYEDALKNIIFKLTRKVQLTPEENKIVEDIINEELEHESSE